MTKTELEKKSLSELHALAAEAGVERYRMLPRAELIGKLAGEEKGSGPARGGSPKGSAPKSGPGRERPPRRRRRSGGKAEQGGERRSRAQAREPEPREEPKPEPPRPTAPASSSAGPSSEPSRPRRRRRRRFGRRGKQEVTVQGLLLPPAGRQVLLTAEGREACTALLRGIAADLSDASKDVDPVALLIDPSPEELADWRRDAPQAEIVAAGQPRHADDALAQAKTRAEGGEDVILLVDSLTRLGAAHGDADAAQEFFDAAGGRLTVVAAVERS
ncbi:MAG TPA: Rho termination factor N-terminal domain-containing protein [Solirubrobacterales bacterium]|nr:Rho termination factor N-terminal domain-containing protein [Solirubrobacterales bacterium]